MLTRPDIYVIFLKTGSSRILDKAFRQVNWTNFCWSTRPDQTGHTILAEFLFPSIADLSRTCVLVSDVSPSRFYFPKNVGLFSRNLGTLVFTESF